MKKLLVLTMMTVMMAACSKDESEESPDFILSSEIASMKLDFETNEAEDINVSTYYQSVPLGKQSSTVSSISVLGPGHESLYGVTVPKYYKCNGEEYITINDITTKIDISYKELYVGITANSMKPIMALIKNGKNVKVYKTITN